MRANETLKIHRKPQDTASHKTSDNGIDPVKCLCLSLCLHITRSHLLQLLNKKTHFAFVNSKKPQNRQQHCIVTSATAHALSQALQQNQLSNN